MQTRFTLFTRAGYKSNKFPWMTGTVSLFCLFLAIQLADDYSLPVVHLLWLPALTFVLCLLTMHSHIFRVLYFGFAAGTFVFGLLYGTVISPLQGELEKSVLLVIFALTMAVFGVINFTRHKPEY